MFKEIFGFSCPGFETPEELEQIQLQSAYEMVKDSMLKEERQKKGEADEEAQT